MSKGLLLDTCAAIWLMEGEPITETSRGAIRKAVQSQALHVSSFVAWEVALLHARSRRAFMAEPTAWFSLLSQVPGLTIAPLTVAVLIACQQLPGHIHNDPADRITIATAREFGLVLVTRDRTILAYGAAGHVAVMAC